MDDYDAIKRKKGTANAVPFFLFSEKLLAGGGDWGVHWREPVVAVLFGAAG